MRCGGKQEGVFPRLQAGDLSSAHHRGRITVTCHMKGGGWTIETVAMCPGGTGKEAEECLTSLLQLTCNYFLKGFVSTYIKWIH